MTPLDFLPMLTRVLEEVNQISLPGPGFTRPSYSNEETRAHECIAEICEELGLKIHRDPAGNLFARLPDATGHCLRSILVRIWILSVRVEPMTERLVSRPR